MLLCDEHHRLIDKRDVAGHSVERLTVMKRIHEERIAVLSALTPDKRTHILLYGANIGVHGSPLCYKEACISIMPHRYPAFVRPIELSMKNGMQTDDTPLYWQQQEEQLTMAFNREVASLKGNHEVQHFSVFGLAPMPLLIKLGTLLSDLYEADVYQRHREPVTWQWQTHSYSGNQPFFVLKPPAKAGGPPALNISLSATVTDDRISTTVGSEASVWTLTHTNPGNDFLKSKELLQEFRTIVRYSLDFIKQQHGQRTTLKVFPAMPVAASIEFGRVWMSKADMPMVIYDQNNKIGTFIEAITIK
jgi:hypothetical protein